MAKSIQLEFKEKLFNLNNLAQSKFTSLKQKTASLTYSEMRWVSNCEDFFIAKQYLTEKHFEVLDSINKAVSQRIY